jgi:hypothetical protein
MVKVKLWLVTAVEQKEHSTVMMATMTVILGQNFDLYFRRIMLPFLPKHCHLHCKNCYNYFVNKVLFVF